MDDKISIDKMVNAGSNMDKLQKSILLVGPSHSGRTTYAELLKKYQYGTPSQNLIYDAAKGNYNLQGIISSKSIKMHTVYPAVYGKNKKDKQEVKVIDVPTIIFTPDKKWTAQQQKITLEYLIAKNTKVGFLIFIEEKYTRTNINTWKKAIMNFLDLFKGEALTQEVFNSVGILITKSPNQIKEDVMINRFKSMKPAFQKDKMNPAIVEKLFKSIIQNNHLFIFKKTTGDQAQKESILTSWYEIQKLSNYNVNKQDFKEIAWPAQSQKAISQYFSSTQICLEHLQRLSIKIFQLQELTNEHLKQAKKQHPQILNNDIQINEQVKKRLSSKEETGSKYVNFINNYIELLDQFQNVTTDNFEHFIWKFTKFGFFSQPKDERLFQLIFEGLEFKRIIDFRQFDLQQNIKKFKDIFSDKVKASVFKKLILAESGNESKQFYQKAILLMQQQFPNGLPEFLKEYQKIFKKKLIKYSNPDQALKIYYEELGKEKNNEKIFEIGNDIGEILKNKKKFIEAARIYKLINNIGQALICFKEVAQKDSAFIGQYTSYLAELYLFEQALRYCYESFSKLGYNLKVKLTENINQIIQKRNEAKTVKNVLLGDIQANEVNEVRKITKGIIETL